MDNETNNSRVSVVLYSIRGLGVSIIIVSIFFTQLIAMIIGEIHWVMVQYLHINVLPQKPKKTLPLYEGEERRKY